MLGHLPYSTVWLTAEHLAAQQPVRAPLRESLQKEQESASRLLVAPAGPGIAAHNALSPVVSLPVPMRKVAFDTSLRVAQAQTTNSACRVEH